MASIKWHFYWQGSIFWSFMVSRLYLCFLWYSSFFIRNCREIKSVNEYLVGSRSASMYGFQYFLSIFLLIVESVRDIVWDKSVFTISTESVLSVNCIEFNDNWNKFVQFFFLFSRPRCALHFSHWPSLHHRRSMDKRHYPT